MHNDNNGKIYCRLGIFDSFARDNDIADQSKSLEGVHVTRWHIQHRIITDAIPGISKGISNINSIFWWEY